MTDHAVVIAGGGPAGLTLAAELRLAGVDAVIVERRPNQELESRRAGGLHARTLEVLDQRGAVERFLAAGQRFPTVGFAGTQLTIADFPSRHNATLALWQRDIEVILATWVLDELGAPILREREVIGVTQDDDRVNVALADGTSLRAQYVVGCDGGRSVVRKAAGIDFVGYDASASYLIADVELAEQPPLGMRPEGGGIGPANPGADDGLYGVVLREAGTHAASAPTLDDLRARLVELYGRDFGAHSPRWISRFNDASRQAATYRAGRVLLAGDAAHIHGPYGGQGLNTGVQDAVNLGWKLALVVNGFAPDALLDTYHAERHPVGARVLHNTMAQVALMNTEARANALRELTVELLALDEPRKRIAGMISGLDITYDLGAGHPLVGRRMPDLDVQTAAGATRVFTLLHDGRGVLLNFGADRAFDAERWGARLRFVRATYDGAWELPVVGVVAAPSAVLVRPDGHVAWTGDVADAELPDVITQWFGAPKST